ncbi:MAG: hypothetical protein RLZZ419_683 [Pseudomonadota bacterium]|jgi:opacity protein-like surface antigen
MINKKNKIYLGVALATLTMAGALVSPQAAAKHKAVKHRSAETTGYSASSKTDMLEAQLRSMQDEIASLRAQVNATGSAPVAAADAQKVQELDAWMTSVKSEPVSKKSKDNMLYFRGGYTGNDESMRATTNTAGNGTDTTIQLPGTTAGNSGGWNFGAGIDFSLNDNMFGLMDKTELLGELDLNYVDLGTFTSGLTPTLAGGILPGTTASQSMLRINASPKIKFMKGSKFRPWLIPVGFTFNIISPPSQANAITELKPGMNFGTGMDYNIWKSLYLGADVRYFLATSSLDGTNVNGLTAGGSLGFGF